MIKDEWQYYAARTGAVTNSISLDLLKRSFRVVYSRFETDNYFYEALGHKCVDGANGYQFRDIPGAWDDDVETFIFMKTKQTDTWPLKDKLVTFDEAKLFSILEFLYDYVSKPIKGERHMWENCGMHYYEFDKDAAKNEYRTEINKLLRDYGSGYELSEGGYIRQLPKSGMERLLDASSYVSKDPNNLDDRINATIRKYTRHGATMEDKKGALQELGGVLEFLRETIKLHSKDDDALFTILNKFDIRHHNQSQMKEYAKDVWYDYFFYTFLASVFTLIKLKNKPAQVTESGA